MFKTSQSRADLLLVLESDGKEALYVVPSLCFTARPREKDPHCLLFHQSTLSSSAFLKIKMFQAAICFIWMK